MKRHFNASIILAAALLAMSAKGNAGPNTYSCTIEGWYTAIPEFDWFFEDAKRETIQINRDTGHVLHSYVGNTTYANIYLLNRGDSEWSFTVFADSGRQSFGQGNSGGHTHYFAVREFVEGYVKPFVGVVNEDPFWGTCR